MKTYYELENGIDTGEHFVHKTHPYYEFLLEEIRNNTAQLLQKEPEPVAPQTWESVRSKRDQLLKDSDWAALPDAALANKNAWLTYRSVLRQIPQVYTNPNKILWPIKPSS
jgi:hypothetical protein